MQIMIWVVPLMFASEFLGYIVVIAGHESRVARSIGVSTTLNVVLNILLIPRFWHSGGGDHDRLDGGRSCCPIYLDIT